MLEGEITPGVEVILLHIVPLFVEERRRIEAMNYLIDLAERLGGDPKLWRCEVQESLYVPTGIVTFAKRERVDLIVMYTHDRKGLARVIKGSVAGYVQRKAATGVKVLKPRDLAGVA